jgi:hypothetical protein
MIAAIIGISSGLLIILVFVVLKQLNKKLMYGIILACIGFLYVGYVWTDLTALIINCMQAIVFLFLAYYGINKSVFILAAGYFLHGGWDIVYNLLATPGLVPPHYDLFCSTLDFTLGAYILIFKRSFQNKNVSF